MYARIRAGAAAINEMLAMLVMCIAPVFVVTLAVAADAPSHDGPAPDVPAHVVPRQAVTPAAGGVAPASTGLELVPATAGEVLSAVKSAGAKAVVVNLWATWCVPCRQEFPDLMRFYRDFKDRGVALVLVSGDFETEIAPAKEFLASQGVNFRTFLKAQKDEEFINALDPAWTGALPATFVYDASGQRRHSFLGPITYESLANEVAPMAGAAH